MVSVLCWHTGACRGTAAVSNITVSEKFTSDSSETQNNTAYFLDLVLFSHLLCSVLLRACCELFCCLKKPKLRKKAKKVVSSG